MATNDLTYRVGAMQVNDPASIADVVYRMADIIASLEAKIDRLEADRHNHEHDALALEAADAMADANRYQWD